VCRRGVLKTGRPSSQRAARYRLACGLRAAVVSVIALPALTL
jgi:hypothetical protein